MMPWVGIFFYSPPKYFIMKEKIIKKWNWDNGTDFANWINGEITDKVLAEFWYWYRDLKKKVSDLSDSDHEDVVLAEIGELSFEGLPLPTLDTKFYICGKEFKVRDALSFATMTVEQVANDYPDSPDGWASIEDVREFALGFFCGVVRGMLN